MDSNDLHSVLINVLSNVIGNIGAFVLLLLLAILLGLPSLITRATFFGTRRQDFEVQILLSNLQVRKKGAGGFSGGPYHYSGEAAPFFEMKAVVPLVNLWGGGRLSRYSQPVRRVVERMLPSTKPLNVRVDLSPTHIRKSELSGTVICVGARYYNSMTDYVWKQVQPLLHIVEGGKALRLRGWDREWPYLEADALTPGVEFAFLQKFRDHQLGTTFFVCSGLAQVGTTGGVQFLAKHWRALAKFYGSGDFEIGLAFVGLNDPYLAQRPQLVYVSSSTRRSGLGRDLARMTRTPWLEEDYSRAVRDRPDQARLSCALSRLGKSSPKKDKRRSD